MIPEPRPLEYATKEDLLQLELKLTTLILDAKVDIIRWNIITMLGFAGTVAAIVRFL